MGIENRLAIYRDSKGQSHCRVTNRWAIYHGGTHTKHFIYGPDENGQTRIREADLIIEFLTEIFEPEIERPVKRFYDRLYSPPSFSTHGITTRISLN